MLLSRLLQEEHHVPLPRGPRRGAAQEAAPCSDVIVPQEGPVLVRGRGQRSELRQAGCFQ